MKFVFADQVNIRAYRQDKYKAAKDIIHFCMKVRCFPEGDFVIHVFCLSVQKITLPFLCILYGLSKECSGKRKRINRTASGMKTSSEEYEFIEKISIQLYH